MTGTTGPSSPPHAPTADRSPTQPEAATTSAATTPGDGPLLRAHGLTLGYGRADVVHGVDLDVTPGRLTVLVVDRPSRRDISNPCRAGGGMRSHDRPLSVNGGGRRPPEWIRIARIYH